jgi:hypothetical protein
MQQAIDQGLVQGYGMGMGHLDEKKIYHDGRHRFLLREEP